jgi:hypothetical protein
MKNPKSETRNPKQTPNPKLEIRNRCPRVLVIWNLPFETGFGFRTSDFLESFCADLLR